MSEAVELEPCPWCGPGNSIPGVWFDDMVKAHRVSCGRCGSGTGFGPRWTADDAIAAWNRRALTKTEGEPVAWTNLLALDSVKHAPKEAAWMWGLPNGSDDGSPYTICVPLYTRSSVWPDREAVALFERFKVRSVRNVLGEIAPGSYALDEWENLPGSFKGDFYDDADAILALPASDGVSQPLVERTVVEIPPLTEEQRAYLEPLLRREPVDMSVVIGGPSAALSDGAGQEGEG